jgi:hypothetical protein
VTGYGPWTQISCSAVHPAGNGQTDTEVHWAIRRWESSVEGEIEIEVYVYNQSADGDGTIARVFHNDTEIGTALTDGYSVRLFVTATVAVGDTLDFAIDSDGAGNLEALGIDAVLDGADTTRQLITIRVPTEVSGPLFDRGDADGNGQRNIGDAIFVLGYLFGGGATPGCLDAADADDNATVNIGDAIGILSHLFGGAGDLPPPFDTCGEDPPPEDGLGCVSYPPCGTGVK